MRAMFTLISEALDDGRLSKNAAISPSRYKGQSPQAPLPQQAYTSGLEAMKGHADVQQAVNRALLERLPKVEKQPKPESTYEQTMARRMARGGQAMPTAQPTDILPPQQASPFARALSKLKGLFVEASDRMEKSALFEQLKGKLRRTPQQKLIEDVIKSIPQEEHVKAKQTEDPLRYLVEQAAPRYYLGDVMRNLGQGNVEWGANMLTRELQEKALPTEKPFHEALYEALKDPHEKATQTADLQGLLGGAGLGLGGLSLLQQFMGGDQEPTQQPDYRAMAMEAQQPTLGQMVTKKVAADKLAAIGQRTAYAGGRSALPEGMATLAPAGYEDGAPVMDWFDPNNPEDVQHLPEFLRTGFGAMGRSVDPSALAPAMRHESKSGLGRVLSTLINPYAAMRRSSLPVVGTGAGQQARQAMAGLASAVGQPGTSQHQALQQIAGGKRLDRGAFAAMLPEIKSRIAQMTGRGGRDIGGQAQQLLEMAGGGAPGARAFGVAQGPMGNINTGGTQAPMQVPWMKLMGGAAGLILLNRLMQNMGLGR